MFHPQVKTMELLPLVCLCLVTWSGSTSADVTVFVKEGSDVILPCSINEDLELKLFDWRKDGQKKEVFLYDAGKHYNNGHPGQDQQFKGRVSHFEDELRDGNASITIRNTTKDDSGDYTCDFPHLHPRQTFHIKLHVGAAPKPYVTTLDQTKDWSLLQCVVRGAFPKLKVEWQDSAGNILPAEEPQVLKKGDHYDIILNTTVTKTDRYLCVVTQEEICHQTKAETFVLINGAAAEPSVTILKTDDGVLLQCVVRGASPKPKVEWQDSAGNILPAEEPQVTERGGSYDIILNIPVTKTDTFSCVVTQEEINHQTKAEIYVPLNGDSSSKPMSSLLVGFIGAVVGGIIVILLGAVIFFVFKSYRQSLNASTNTNGASSRDKSDSAENERHHLNSPA